MAAILQVITGVSIFTFAAAADGLMDTYGPGKFLVISLVFAAICFAMIGLSYLIEDYGFDRGRRRK